MGIKVSYGVTVCNELDEIKRLVPFLYKRKRPEDEICVLLDKPKASPSLLDILYWWSSKDWITLKESIFQGHFADWKNELTRMCSGDYIFNIDADECPSSDLVLILPDMLENNPLVDAYLVPRVNTVIGITQEHINKWGWSVNEAGWINWPDWQVRIYKNTPEIRWKNRVHETLEGIKTYANLPREEGYALQHPKTIERQEKQNNYYNTL